MTSHEQIHQIETKLERDRKVLLVAQMVAVFVGTLALIALASMI